ncbi:MAG: UDP-N-acetylglucosamine 1-carboxyvinyltransferase [Candidatus Kerfeldbacteria bacterium CG_4_10_14_0_8_um_filter_42_10]|uniref:UDP-N-acetylglucosamine 1-carboxyvinyltransferase n=1 Tax=Candidatus Kerfeldbacteria bacterium CG_4_10_14_0_8_um_filter_42_10 TaxID=2014248 RepID=A0A2M7RL39_9BACT|nr:MAG: UDP-N-acetylglucosamine 1-carboxyvinyltransferase [Candidatus Kerfeldbacteria bacterium CG_4_10_14_0_8_um_filter_42_10]
MNKFKQVGKKSFLRVARSRPLFGEIEVSGAKNMVTKIMTTCLIATKGRLLIKNVPIINDVFITLKLFDQLGIRYKLNSDKSLEIWPKGFKSSTLAFEGEDGNRIPLLLAAPLLAQLGRAVIPKPKGCKIGTRKIDFHISGLQQFGVRIKEDEQNLHLEISKKGLVGTTVNLPFPSVGATENMIMTAVCAQGASRINNCAIEPEIIELIKFLQRSGVNVVIHEGRSIYICGNRDISLTEVTIIPDRVETMSYAAAAIATKGDVFVKGADHDSLISPISALLDIGAGVDIKDNGIRFYYKGSIKRGNIETEVYPGFQTDFQQPLAIVLSQANGASRIHEKIFESRFIYLQMLNKMIKNRNKAGLTISKECPPESQCRFAGQEYAHTALINGPVKFGSGEIEIPDLRAGFAILIAGLLSDGMIIRNLDSLFRGYDNPVGKLNSLGANIEMFE